MAKKHFYILLSLVLTGLLFFPGCPENGDTAADFTLTVTVGNGVNGTPAAGSYTHSENANVNFNYTAQTGFGNLAVTLDGVPVANSGTIAMNTNHTLDATAIIDVRGTWTGLAENTSGGGPSNYFLEGTFSGGVLSGTVRGRIESLGWANGTYTVNGNQLTFTLNYSGVILACTGTFTNANYVSGEWNWPEAGNPQTGAWHLER